MLQSPTFRDGVCPSAVGDVGDEEADRQCGQMGWPGLRGLRLGFFQWGRRDDGMGVEIRWGQGHFQ